MRGHRSVVPVIPHRSLAVGSWLLLQTTPAKDDQTCSRSPPFLPSSRPPLPALLPVAASGSTELAGFGLYCCGGQKLETIAMTESALRDKDSVPLCHKISAMSLADLAAPSRSAHAAAAAVSATLSADEADTVDRLVLITPSAASLAAGAGDGDDADEDPADALDEVDEALVSGPGLSRS